MSSRIATEFRQQFKSDIVIDMFCYRRLRPQRGRRAGLHPAADVQGDRQPPDGEGDLCRAARGRGRGRRAAEVAAARCGDLREKLDKALEAATQLQAQQGRLAGRRAGRASTVAPGEEDRKGDDRRRASSSCGRSATRSPSAPQGLRPQPQDRAPARRRSARRSRPARTSTGRPARRWPSARCWPRARRCGCPARTSGRGTFSQRHAVLVDQSTEAKYIPLNHVAARARRASRSSTARCPRRACWASSTAIRSAEPNALVMWEAQFGDFANGAQVIIDQFICSGESKWLRMYGLVMLLPHGYEGQGPEHSSARLERYLQLSPRTTCRSSCRPRRPTTSMRCAARCAASSASR